MKRRNSIQPLIGCFSIWGLFAFWSHDLAGASVWPGEDWVMATPQSQGLSDAGLKAAAEYALEHGGGSGCIIRHGYLVREWGDPAKLADIKSATKGSVGATMLGLAVDDGLVKLEDLAQKHYPAIGAEKPENQKDWLGQITVRHLATMTAGFDDGRPPKLTRRPGTEGEYSNDTSNMLAELLTLRFGEDLRDLFKRRVMDVIGAPPSEWAWRENSFRPKSLAGLKAREFASGITITHRTLARLGYLYLRAGEWNGRRILSKEYIRAATQPTDLPAFVPYYAFYWGSNARGTYPGMPKDTFWALGLGDSFVLVCPSLDIVAVRLGVGSNKSRLPGDLDDTNWGKRVEGFFSLVVKAAEKRRAAAPPRPPSPVIAGIEWAPSETIVRRAKGSDNWPLTWADDDALYGAYGDGNGFEPFIAEKLSMGFAKIIGGPRDFTAKNLRTASGETRGDGPTGRKASGLLCVDGILYLWTRNAGNSQLAWSKDHGVTWTWADWRFTESFGCPSFLNFGKNYAGARDDFVYVYSPDSNSAYQTADHVVLARAPKADLRTRESYEFFAGFDAANTPRWTRDISQRNPVFSHPGRCYRTSVTWHAALKRYLLVQPVPGNASVDRSARIDTRFNAGLAVFDAPEPWGPWTTAFFTDQWDVGPGDSASFPSKWMSADGNTLHLVFSGDDFFSVRQAKLAPAACVKIVDGKWQIGGAVTYPSTHAEGLLMNVRMVNATFEDANDQTRPKGFDPEANTDAFIARIPEYVATGVRAFTLNLQGGMPNYLGAANSAFLSDGSLREAYLARVRRAIDACARHGAVVILGCYYQQQDQILRDGDAVRAGVVHVARWLRAGEFRNVLLEIANEFGHSGFDHEILKSPDGQVELIRLAKEAAPDLLVSTSPLGHGRVPEQVARASDFLLVHFNGTPLADIPSRLAALKKFGKPIVCNEDDKIATEGARAAATCVANGASWGLMLKTVNQFHPFKFEGAADDRVVYAALRELTSAPIATKSAMEGYFPPPESKGGWRMLTEPEEIRSMAGMDPEKLAALRAWLLGSDQRDFAAVVIRRGHIVLEVERGNSARTDARRVASVSKAICATVLAIASERSLQGETPKKMKFEDRAFDFIPWAQPLSDPRKAAITVRQLLNHTSGISPEATGSRNEGTWEYILGHTGDERTAKLAFDPGTACGYSTHAFHHAALVCETVTGKPYDEFAIEALFKPLGIEHWTFQTFNGDALHGRHASHSLGLPTRDLARIGYCMTRDGRWGERQIVPKWFVDETAAPTHAVTGPEMRFKINAQSFSHGWELPARLDGERGRGLPADARYKPGSGGQLLAFVPSLDLVIARQTGGSGDWAYDEFLRRACAAVIANDGPP